MVTCDFNFFFDKKEHQEHREDEIVEFMGKSRFHFLQRKNDQNILQYVIDTE